MKLKTILLATFLTLSIIAFLQNLEIVEYQFLFWYLALPKAIFATLFIGFGMLFWVLARKAFKRKVADEDNVD